MCGRVGGLHQATIGTPGTQALRVGGQGPGTQPTTRTRPRGRLTAIRGRSGWRAAGSGAATGPSSLQTRDTGPRRHRRLRRSRRTPHPPASRGPGSRDPTGGTEPRAKRPPPLCAGGRAHRRGTPHHPAPRGGGRGCRAQPRQRNPALCATSQPRLPRGSGAAGVPRPALAPKTRHRHTRTSRPEPDGEHAPRRATSPV